LEDDAEATVNLGLRYELISTIIDKNDILLNFDPAGNNGTGRIIVPSSKPFNSWIPGFRIVPNCTADKSGLGIGRGLVRTDKNNLHLGLVLHCGLARTRLCAADMAFTINCCRTWDSRSLSTNAFNQRLTKTNKA